MHILRFISGLSTVSAMLLLGWQVAADTVLFDPDTGLRVANYRAPVPETPPGVDAISIDHLEVEMREQFVLVDVRPLKLFEIREDGTWVIPEPIETIPGAIWLPGIGRGQIESWTVEYMRASLEQITHPDQTIVVFCRIDCWHSWNAAQRVSALGYDTRWFDGGVDAWQDAGNELEWTEPWPVPK